MLNLPTLDELVEGRPSWLASLKAFDPRIDAVSASHEDNDLDGHQSRVARSAMDLASAFGFADAESKLIGAAALVHDVGKLTIDLSVLNKEGAFTPLEREIMNRHAHSGARLLQVIDGLPTIFIDVARYHHERYDGKGYEGLRGEGIPFAARIVQIADVHDALSRKRVYKLGSPEGKVLCEMTDREGRIGRSMFDPVLLRSFVAMRMAAQGFQATAPERADLAAYVSSDPNLDLATDCDVEFKVGGARVVGGTWYDPREVPPGLDAPRL